MKRLLASLIIVPFLFAACSDEEGKDKDQSANKEQTTQKDKKENQDKQKENKAKDSKDKDNKGKEDQSNDNNATSSDNNQNSHANPNTNDTQQNQTQQGQSSAQGQQNNTPNSNGNSQTSQSSNGSQSQPKYVAPYQGQNVAPVAQNIVSQQVDRQQALRFLPNFQTSLDNAQTEVNRLNGQNNPYNDYALQGDGGHYSYMFSFINLSQPGTYTIVTVDGTGQAKIIDPAYRQ